MKKRLTVLICNDMRDPSDPIVVTISAALPIDVILQSKIAHAEAEMADFDGDPLTAADLWEVSQAYILAVIPGPVRINFVEDDPKSLHWALTDVIDASPLCEMGEGHE